MVADALLRLPNKSKDKEKNHLYNEKRYKTTQKFYFESMSLQEHYIVPNQFQEVGTVAKLIYTPSAKVKQEKPL